MRVTQTEMAHTSNAIRSGHGAVLSSMKSRKTKRILTKVIIKMAAVA